MFREMYQNGEHVFSESCSFYEIAYLSESVIFSVLFSSLEIAKTLHLISGAEK